MRGIVTGFAVFLVVIGLFTPVQAQAQHEGFSLLSSVTVPRLPYIEFPEQRYGVVKNGTYATFVPYSSATVTHGNKLTFLKPHHPVIILGTNEENSFLFVNAGIVKGWVRRTYLTIVEKDHFERHITAPVVILRKDMLIDGTLYPVATRLVLDEIRDAGYAVVVYRENGEPVTVEIRKEYAALPSEISRLTLQKTATYFKKRPYAWANSEQGWDCSGLMMDFFSFFNIRLPRNSFEQINAVKKVDVSKLSVRQKSKILKTARPYLTLLYFPGHIMLYTGKSGREFMSFQALNRIGKKVHGKVGFFPLLKTGLLKRVTQIGYVDEPPAGI